jgi:hypothetical protein
MVMVMVMMWLLWVRPVLLILHQLLPLWCWLQQL